MDLIATIERLKHSLIAKLLLMDKIVRVSKALAMDALNQFGWVLVRFDSVQTIPDVTQINRSVVNQIDKKNVMSYIATLACI